MRHGAATAAAAMLLLALGACKSGEQDRQQHRRRSGHHHRTGQCRGRDRSRGGRARYQRAERRGHADERARGGAGLLNKRNGVAREFKLKPGQAARIGDVIVRLRACDKTAPWEADQLTGAFVQVDVQQLDKSWRRVFSGWLYKERPALNVVQHPIYDVWPKSCAMTFRDSGPDTVPAPSRAADRADRSSAEKSPSTEGTPSESPAVESPSAAPSNAT
jgi:hypothetical protein